MNNEVIDLLLESANDLVGEDNQNDSKLYTKQIEHLHKVFPNMPIEKLSVILNSKMEANRQYADSAASSKNENSRRNGNNDGVGSVKSIGKISEKKFTDLDSVIDEYKNAKANHRDVSGISSKLKNLSDKDDTLKFYVKNKTGDNKFIKK